MIVVQRFVIKVVAFGWDIALDLIQDVAFPRSPSPHASNNGLESGMRNAYPTRILQYTREHVEVRQCGKLNSSSIKIRQRSSNFGIGQSRKLNGISIGTLSLEDNGTRRVIDSISFKNIRKDNLLFIRMKHQNLIAYFRSDPFFRVP